MSEQQEAMSKIMQLIHRDGGLHETGLDIHYLTDMANGAFYITDVKVSPRGLHTQNLTWLEGFAVGYKYGREATK